MEQARVNDWWMSGFGADTPVLMVDGARKPISKIKEGDWVVSFDPITKEIVPGKVTNTWYQVTNDVLNVQVEGKQDLLVASKQRFFTANGEFKAAPDAESVLSEDGKARKISASKAKGKTKIYDITVDRTHSFYADGLMVHNGGGGGGSRPPPPPPDPVVTAGKVGQPLTVTVNGSKISVGAQPDVAAQVGVTYQGKTTTGYSGTPGVGVITGVLRPVRFPKAPRYLDASVALQAALDTEATVCTSMKGTSGSVTGAVKSGWTRQLEELKRQLLTAKRATDYPWIVPMTSPSTYSSIGRGMTEPVAGINDVITQVDELKKYVNKNRNLTAKDNEFISGKCLFLDTQIRNIKSTVDARLNNNPNEPLPGDVIWDNDPNYQYYIGSGEGPYILRFPYEPYGPAEIEANKPKWWKYQATDGRYYLTQTPKTVRIFAPD